MVLVVPLFVLDMKRFTWLCALLTYCGALQYADGHCIDLNSNIVSQGLHYVPGTNPCTVCICDKGSPKWCKSVLCSAPQNCKSFQVGNTCCEFKCLDDILTGSDTYKETYDVALRFIASAVTAVLSLSLLFFLFHRLRRRKLLMHHQNQQIGDDQRSLSSIGYIAGSLGYLPESYLSSGNNELEFHYEDATAHYTLWKPPGNYFPRGEAPPPYEEAMRTGAGGAGVTVAAIAAAGTSGGGCPVGGGVGSTATNSGAGSTVALVADADDALLLSTQLRTASNTILNSLSSIASRAHQQQQQQIPLHHQHQMIASGGMSAAVTGQLAQQQIAVTSTTIGSSSGSSQVGSGGNIVPTCGGTAAQCGTINHGQSDLICRHDSNTLTPVVSSSANSAAQGSSCRQEVLRNGSDVVNVSGSNNNQYVNITVQNVVVHNSAAQDTSINTTAKCDEPCPGNGTSKVSRKDHHHHHHHHHPQQQQQQTLSQQQQHQPHSGLKNRNVSNIEKGYEPITYTLNNKNVNKRLSCTTPISSSSSTTATTAPISLAHAPTNNITSTTMTTTSVTPPSSSNRSHRTQSTSTPSVVNSSTTNVVTVDAASNTPSQHIRYENLSQVQQQHHTPQQYHNGTDFNGHGGKSDYSNSNSQRHGGVKNHNGHHHGYHHHHHHHHHSGTPNAGTAASNCNNLKSSRSQDSLRKGGGNAHNSDCATTSTTTSATANSNTSTAVGNGSTVGAGGYTVGAGGGYIGSMHGSTFRILDGYKNIEVIRNKDTMIITEGVLVRNKDDYYDTSSGQLQQRRKSTHSYHHVPHHSGGITASTTGPVTTSSHYGNNGGHHHHHHGNYTGLHYSTSHCATEPTASSSLRRPASAISCGGGAMMSSNTPLHRTLPKNVSELLACSSVADITNLLESHAPPGCSGDTNTNTSIGNNGSGRRFSKNHHTGNMQHESNNRKQLSVAPTGASTPTSSGGSFVMAASAINRCDSAVISAQSQLRTVCNGVTRSQGNLSSGAVGSGEDANGGVRASSKSLAAYQCLSSSQDDDDYRSECENCKSSAMASAACEDEEADVLNETMTLQRRPLESGDDVPYYRTSLTLPTNTRKPRILPTATNREAWFSTMQATSSSDSE